MMARLAIGSLLDSLPKVHLPICELCLTEKATVKLFDKTKRLELVHSDICIPMSLHDVYYVITYIDDYTLCGFVSRFLRS